MQWRVQFLQHVWLLPRCSTESGKELALHAHENAENILGIYVLIEVSILENVWIQTLDPSAEDGFC